jgi:hypothetical protein
MGKATIKPSVVIRKRMTWKGLSDAARILDVTETQVRRHVSGEDFSKALARRMAERGVVVEA